jgi:hypothetical protein
MKSSFFLSSSFLLLPSCGGGISFAAALGLNQPTELRSENGLLEVTLTVDDLLSVNGTKTAPAYNGEPW